MIEQSIDRLAGLAVWAEPVAPFLRRAATLGWLGEIQGEVGRSDDETTLLLLAAMRSIDLTILDGQRGPDELEQFLVQHSDSLQNLCRTRRVQANVAERGLPLLELLGRRWGRQRLFVTELGSSFGLIGRVLVSSPATLQNFDRYFGPCQQRPTALPFVAGYHGIDLDPPDERWLLACIPVADLRTRVARFIYEVPADARVTVTRGSALEPGLWPVPPPGAIPVMLTSFMLYQLPPPLRQTLVDSITGYVAARGGTWVNLDVLTDGPHTRFVVQEDGIDKIDLENDFCVSWGWR